MIKIKKGLDLPITGKPEQKIYNAPKTSHVALIGNDYVGMKPTMNVQVGDVVKKGQILFSDKKTEGVHFTAPAAGEVVQINRGERRAFNSLVIKVNGSDHVKFSSYKGSDLAGYNSDDLKDLLLESGLWTSLRMRPFNKTANPNKKAESLFITAMDTEPLAADANLIINEYSGAFELGLQFLDKFFDGNKYLCSNPELKTNHPEKIEHKVFTGKHPAGNAGTHIHFLNPVSFDKHAWHIHYMDVIAIGKLLVSGELFTERVISLAGPMAKNPRLLKIEQGACLSEVLPGEIKEGDVRVVSGSVLNGREAEKVFDYLGRYHRQVSLLEEGTQREFLGWQAPGFNKFSVKGVFLSSLFPSKKFAFNTSLNGSERAIVPIGSYEKVMPLDIQPTFLLRSIMSRNLEMAQKLGALELAEEDLALCTFVCPCKNEYGSVLRENLTAIEKEG